MIEEDIDIIFEEIVNNKDFIKSDIEIETFDKIEELKFPQEYENNSIIILDDLNEKEIYNDKTQAMPKRSLHNKLSVFIISQDYDYYELPNRTIRPIGNIYHIFKPNNFRDVQKQYQDKASTDTTLNEFNCLTSTCWKKNYQSLTIDMTKDKFTGRYRSGLNNIFVPDSSLFWNSQWVIIQMYQNKILIIYVN